MIELKEEPGAMAQQKSVSAAGVRRILMSSDTLGGVWSYSLELARALGKHGVQVVLATMGAPLTRTQRVEIASLRNVKVMESGFRLEWMEAPWEDVDRAGQWLLSLEKRFCPEVVHLNGYAHAALGWSAPAVVAAHSCILSWWEAVKREAAPEIYNVYRQRVGRGLRAARAVVAPTRAMLEALQKFHGAIPNAQVIHNGIKGQVFQSGSAKKCRLLAAGRVWDEGKNFRLLDEAAQGVKWPVLLAGAKKTEQRFPNLHMLGALSRKELMAQYKEAAVFVSPALYEPFGLAALEAAHCGCALLLSDLPTFREIWGEAALYFESGDVGSLRRAMSQLCEDPQLRLEMAGRAEARAEELSAEAMAEAYLGFYKQVCV